MKKKVKQICCVLALMSVFSFSAGITALTASADSVTTVNAETSVETTQQDSEVKKLVAALESDVYFVNGIPYVDIVKEGTANGARSVSETVTVIPDLTVNASGYITHVTSMDGAVEIPEKTENGTTIVGINGSAFRNVSITEIVIPATIKEIKSSAFNGCVSLVKVVFKSSTNVTSEVGLTIQTRAFNNCSQLVEVILPKHLLALHNETFSSCRGLKNIYIEEGCAGYRNGTGGYAGVVYTTDQVVDSVETSYIWPIAKQKYTINLIAGTDSTLFEQRIVAGGHAITLPLAAGTQIISGWYLDAEFTSEMYTTEYFVAENKDVTSYTLYAKIENSAPTNSYVLTFDLQGGTQSQLENPMVLPIGEELNLSAYIPERDGYDFAGWYSLPAKNGDKIVDETGIGTSFSEDIGSMTLYAAWTAHRYTINFFNYDESEVFYLELDYGSTISARLPERVGYKFDGWFDGLEETAINFTDENNIFSTDAWRVEEDKTLDFYAHYRAHQYDISVYCDKCDETYSFGKATYDQPVAISAPCNHLGYELSGWEAYDATYTESFVWKYAGIQEFNTVWEATEYTITYMEDNAVISAPNGCPTTYTIESNFTFPTITRVGYNDVYLRDGTNNRLTGIAPGCTDDLTLYIVKDDPVKVNVTLNYYGAYANEIKELTYGNTYTLPTDKSLTGYRYDGWEDSQGNKLTNTNISNLLVDTTYYIKWIGTVTLKDENGNEIGTVDLQYGKQFSIDPYTKAGYTFQGWSTSQTSDAYVTDGKGNGIGTFNVQNSLILYARITANTYTITFDNQGGQGGVSQLDVVYGTNSSAVQTPVKTGYTFKGYYTKPNGAGVCYFNQNGQYMQGSTWAIEANLQLYADYDIITITVNLNLMGGSGQTSVSVAYGETLPTIAIPTKTDWDFKGFYTSTNGNGTQYYTAEGIGIICKRTEDFTLYAYWTAHEYLITLELYNGMTSEAYACYGGKVEADYAPYRSHYEFKGYYSQPNGGGTCYVKGVVTELSNGIFHMEPESTSATWNQHSDGVLYAYWELLKADYSITVVSIGNGYLDSRTVSITSEQSMTLSANTPSGYTFDSWMINNITYTTENVTYTFELHRSYVTGEITLFNPNFTGSATYSDGYISLYFQKNPEEESCVAAGTLITLADGRQVPVESLTGNEMLLVWNLHTGRFDTAPILFIDHDALAMYKIINLRFSDGTIVKVIDEHAFWDFNLNKYVFLREDASQYIGHWFNKQTMDANGNMIWTRVQLTNVTITEEYTTAWSPVTYGHLCIYVNGMLSMPGATEGLINIFEVDGETMQIKQEQYLADIATYGLFTYEEFAEIYPVPETIFEAFGGEYLKVSIGKGLIDYETLGELIERYSEFFE